MIHSKFQLNLVYRVRSCYLNVMKNEDIKWQLTWINNSHETSTLDKELQANKEYWVWRNILPQGREQKFFTTVKSIYTQLIIWNEQIIFFFIWKCIYIYIYIFRKIGHEFEKEWEFGIWKNLEEGKKKERNNVIIFSNNKYFKRREGNLWRIPIFNCNYYIFVQFICNKIMNTLFLKIQYLN